MHSPLITVINAHIKGTSGMDNAMMSRTIAEELKTLTPNNRRQLHAMLASYAMSQDEDVVRVTEWVQQEVVK